MGTPSRLRRRLAWALGLGAAVLVAAVVVYEILLGLGVAGWKTVWRIEGLYGDEVEAVCAEHDLPPNYFKALIYLESSGIQAPTRFEPGVYDKLLEVRDGRREAYGLITPETIVDASDEAVANLATSWGPLQIMGYHCVEIGVLVHSLRDADALEWGILWADQTYGRYLREDRPRDAFHMHNAGRPYPEDGPPRTHDPRYVGRGLRLMRAFALVGWR
jgi:hypothetical protein